MKTIPISTGRPYSAHIGRGLLPRVGEMIRALPEQRYKKAAVITDDKVGPLYAQVVEDALREAGIEPCTFVFPNGEESKTIDTAMQAVQFFADHTITRSDAVVALGGGVVGDLAGFAAAVWQRGVDYIQIPTTFLAAVDSSVGGKTAVNTPAGKNLVGAFWQPRLVVCDVDTLSTLDPEVFSDGTAESIKHGCIRDEALLLRMEAGGLEEGLVDIVARNIEIKAAVVGEDEREAGLRQILNFGHTVGHGIEKLSNLTLTHGKGVALGMCIVAAAGEAAGITPAGTADRIRKALRVTGLPTECPYPIPEIAKACLGDKKRHGGTINLILLEGIGKPKIHPVPADGIEAFLMGAAGR